MAEWWAFLPGWLVRVPAGALPPWSLWVFSGSPWVPSGYSGFLPYTKDTLKLPCAGNDAELRRSLGGGRGLVYGPFSLRERI